MPAYLGAEDIDNLPHDKLQASSGATLLGSDGTLYRIETITPAQRDDGSCVFLENDRCTVHDTKPVGCRLFNICSEPSGDEEQQSIRELLEIAKSDEYSELRERLPYAKTSTEERRRRLSAALIEIERRSE
jgi:Fe-S-cluster containining protein